MKLNKLIRIKEPNEETNSTGDFLAFCEDEETGKECYLYLSNPDIKCDINADYNYIEKQTNIKGLSPNTEKIPVNERNSISIEFNCGTMIENEAVNNLAQKLLERFK